MWRSNVVALASIAFLYGSGTASSQTCSIPTAKYTSGSLALTARDAGALLLPMGHVAVSKESIDVGSSSMIAVFQSGCWSLNSTLRNQQIWFGINNQSENKSSSNYIGIQILRIKALKKNERPSTVVTANRSDTYTWYRGDQPSNYSTAPQTITADVANWNAAHASGDVIQQNDRFLRGKWHGSVMPGGISTWDSRDRWQINASVQGKYDVVLENRLMAFDIATGAVGKGIPFFVRPRGFDAFIIRYFSTSAEQNGEVRFCFALCSETESLTTSTSDGGLFSSLLSFFRR